MSRESERSRLRADRKRAGAGRWRVWLLRGAVALVVLVLGALGVVVVVLRASLPELGGRRSLPGLSGPVTVERDAMGVATVRGATRVDVARALGWVHGQERFFQMDLMRRQGAGELAGLFGSALVGGDLGMRRHGLREAARRAVEGLSAEDRVVITAYAEGVNDGVSALGARPPEYLLLRSTPEAWRPEDCLLVGFAMFLTLQDDTGREELCNEVVSRALPPAAAEFFFPAASEWDAAIDGSELPRVPVPGPEVLDLRAGARSRAQAEATWKDLGEGAVLGSLLPRRRMGGTPIPGSNSWGVQGAATATGAAIICDDMHLGLGLPNTWFRVCMEWAETGGRRRRVVGASLPGIPSLIVGSNGEVAWAFTNATVDNSDLVEVEVDPSNPGRYRTPDGWRDFETVVERIQVRGEPAREATFRRTIWGPVITPPEASRVLAVIWTAHRPGAADLGLLRLETARSVDEALAVAPRCGVPVQNLLVGDRAGNLAYTVIGKLPKRRGSDGSIPARGGEGKAGWQGWLDPEEVPRFVAPAGGRLWTANNRILGTPGYLGLGIRHTDVGARARQIRDALLALPAPVSEPALFDLYRDDRAVFLERWQRLMASVMETGPAKREGSPGTTLWDEGRDVVRRWEGRASTNSASYRLVRAFRYQVLSRVMAPVMARCDAVKKDGAFWGERQETPVWAVLQARPEHLLDSKFASYDALLVEAVEGVLADLERQNLKPADATWGRRNTVRIVHPISRAVPRLGRWLDLPAMALAGDSNMTRVQGQAFGCSERMVVSPGHEESGYFHMPGGQSGHFLSPFYRAGHEAWERVEPSPLLPGPTRYRLLLEPKSL